MARRKAQPKDDTLKKAVALFANAPAQAATSLRSTAQLTPEYQRIVERVFDLPQPDVAFAECRDALELTDALTPAALAIALNRAERMALLASQLYVCAKAEAEKLDLRLDRVIGAMREGAMEQLQVDKNNGKRSKQITDSDVNGRASQIYPDEWIEMRERQNRASGMLSQLQRLSELWKRRRESLQAMIHATR
jgi:hypothetical protein